MTIRLPRTNVKKLEFREKLRTRDTHLGVIGLRMVFIRKILKTRRPMREWEEVHTLAKRPFPHTANCRTGFSLRALAISPQHIYVSKLHYRSMLHGMISACFFPMLLLNEFEANAVFSQLNFSPPFCHLFTDWLLLYSTGNKAVWLSNDYF